MDRNVSFAYPKGENVIKDVSFTIGKGQAVVIVGINGSGKSTLLKLLNRLYDPTTGTISIDGTPFTSFVGSDVRRSMAMLTQNYTHYPLSVRENIAMGLGDADYSSDYEEDEKRQLSCDGRVREAARLGGAAEIIEKQPNGFDGVLKPSVYAYAMSSSAAGEDFENKMKEITKQADISSGQWQRLALWGIHLSFCRLIWLFVCSVQVSLVFPRCRTTYQAGRCRWAERLVRSKDGIWAVWELAGLEHRAG